jgi:hypothetical protein
MRLENSGAKAPFPPASYFTGLKAGASTSFESEHAARELIKLTTYFSVS